MTNPINTKEFRQALGTFATGITIVTTTGEGGIPIGLTANSFNSVSLDPPMILWSLANSSGAFSAFEKCDNFAVHILAADQEGLSSKFASKGIDKFLGVEAACGTEGIPIIKGCAAVFQCRTVYRYEGGDHTILVGEVLRFETAEKEPLIYHGGGYKVARSSMQPSVEIAQGGIAPSISDLVAQVYLKLVTPVRQRAEQLGLNAAQRYLLNVLLAEGLQSITEINNTISHTGVQVAQADVNHLVDRQIIRDAEGSLALRKWELTLVGRTVALELVSLAKGSETELQDCLDDDQRRAVYDLLSLMVAGLSNWRDERVDHHWSLVSRAKDTFS